MKNTMSKFLFFMLLSAMLVFITSCLASKNPQQTENKITEELKDFAFTIAETSLDFAVAKAEQETKPFTIKVNKLQQDFKVFVSPLGLIKFEVKKDNEDSLILNISPIWLTVADSCKSKINHYLKNEPELLKLLVNTTLKKAILKAQAKIKPYQIQLNDNSIGQYFSPHRLLIIEIKKQENNIFLINISPNIAEMGEIVKNFFRENLDNTTKL